MQKNKKITIMGIILNSMLFVAKLIVGFLSGSLAVLSDAFNSLTDILASIGIFIAVKFSSKRADAGHPFGHHRAEPLAGIMVAIFAGIVAFEIIKIGIQNLFIKTSIIGYSALVVLGFTMIVKLGMSVYFLDQGKKLNSPAIRASGIDSRNDVLISSVAFIGVLGSINGIDFMDSIAAIIIGLFILYSGYKIGVENIDYLMGKAPSKEHLDKIKSVVRKVKGVKGMNDIRAHYVGNFIHIEIHIEVDKKLSTQKSHTIGKNVQNKVEELNHVDKAFIHIDPK
jgi:cation diffusion facilitator family transporter